MAKKAFAGLIIGSAILFSVGASPVSALTVDEVQAQIQSLLQQISSLTNILNTLRGQANTGVGVSVGTLNVPPEPAQHRICRVVWRNLSQGAQGDDVTSLQEFLREQGYLSAGATGYFGPLTAQAVARWQTSEGVSAVGVFGPMSRERIKIWCGGGGIGGGSLQASPTRGNAPLTVYFWHVIGGGSSDGYSMEFGDGTTGTLEIGCGVHPASGIGACPRALTASHTYTQNGTYTASLVRYTNPCGDNPACMAPSSREIVGTVRINVGSVACTMEYNPICGSKQIYCITTPCNPIQQTYSNRCMMNADGASFLYEGQCRDVYGNRPPVISGISGPTTLSENQTGTWTVKASDPENGQLSYNISWGDEVYAVPMANTASYAREFVQTTTFTHAYSNMGTYTITVIVQDSSGQSARTTTTVQVGDGGMCTGEYAPVCGQPPFVCAGPPGTTACVQVMPAPNTYSNRCVMNAAGASFLYNGECNTLSGIKGTLGGAITVGPLCPVVSQWQQCQIGVNYGAYRLFVYTSDVSTLVSTVTADTSGNYSVSLDPGDYYVRVENAGSCVPPTDGYGPVISYHCYGMSNVVGWMPVHVYANIRTTLNIDIDTGIR